MAANDRRNQSSDSMETWRVVARRSCQFQALRKGRKGTQLARFVIVVIGKLYSQYENNLGPKSGATTAACLLQKYYLYYDALSR